MNLSSFIRLIAFLLPGLLMSTAFAKTFVYVANGEGAEIAAGPM